jgi:alkanesulfonate monooxygenase SsuD/methylene tetrahydromethanopterin reductase-like flavin-dependent oxidoreductase (luciferase family)
MFSPNNSSAQRQSAPTVSQETHSPQTTAPEPLGATTCCASSSEGAKVIAELSDRNVEVLRHECYSGAMVTEYRTTDGKRPDPDSIAVRSGIVDLKSDEEWSASQDRLRSHEQSKAQTRSQGEDKPEEPLKALNLQKIPCCHAAPLG